MASRETTPLEVEEVMPACLKWLNAQPHIWAWRRNVVAHKIGGRWVHAGQAGQSDIEGIVTVEFEYFTAGLHLEVEVKRLRKEPTPHQAAWLAATGSHGAIALYADSVEMLEEKLRAAFTRRRLEWPT